MLLQAGQILADTIEGRVVGVSDGDTITVLDSTKTQHKIRLAGIDAPESKQAFGQASKKHLSDLVFDRVVTLDCGKPDKYRGLRRLRWPAGRQSGATEGRHGLVVQAVPEGADGAAKGRLRGGCGCGEGWQGRAMAGC